MELTRDQMAQFARKNGPGEYLAQLKLGDTLPSTNEGRSFIEGPAIVSITVYRDGGWRAVTRPTWRIQDLG